MALIPARWVATYEAELPDGTILTPGVTVLDVPEAEARASEHWKPEAPKPDPAPVDAPKPDPAPLAATGGDA